MMFYLVYGHNFVRNHLKLKSFGLYLRKTSQITALFVFWKLAREQESDPRPLPLVLDHVYACRVFGMISEKWLMKVGGSRHNCHPMDHSQTENFTWTSVRINFNHFSGMEMGFAGNFYSSKYSWRFLNIKCYNFTHWNMTTVSCDLWPLTHLKTRHVM